MAGRALTRSEAEARPRGRLRVGPQARRVLMYATVAGLGLVYALPLLWMISTSLKDDAQTYHVPPIWIPSPMRFVNYAEALTRQPFDLFFVNTLRYSLLSALGALLSATLVAYGFARLR